MLRTRAKIVADASTRLDEYILARDPSIILGRQAEAVAAKCRILVVKGETDECWNLADAYAVAWFLWQRHHADPERNTADLQVAKRLWRQTHRHHPLYGWVPNLFDYTMHSILNAADRLIALAEETGSVFPLMHATDLLVPEQLGRPRASDARAQRRFCTALRLLYQRTRERKYLSLALKTFAEMVKAHRAHHPDVVESQFRLAPLLMEPDQLASNPPDMLRVACNMLYSAVVNTKEDDPQRVARATEAVGTLAATHTRTGDSIPLEYAARCLIDVTAHMLPDDARRDAFVGDLDSLLANLYGRTGESDHLKARMLLAYEQAGAYPEGDARRAEWLYRHGSLLLECHRQDGTLAPLSEACTQLSAARDATAPGAPEYSERAARADEALRELLKLGGHDDPFLAEVSTRSPMLSRDSAPWDAARPAIDELLRRVGRLLRERRHAYSVDILEQMVARLNEACLGATDAERVAAALHHLAVEGYLAHEANGDVALVREAREASRLAVDLSSPTAPGYGEWLSGLSWGHYLLHTASVGECAVGEAIRTGRQAAEALPAGHPGLPQALIGLSLALQESYNRSHDGDVLDEAVRVAERAVTVQASAPGGAGWPSLNCLAMALEKQIGRSPDPELWVRAEETSRAALSRLALGDPGRVTAMSNFAVLLLAIHSRAGSAHPDCDRLLREVIESGRAALRLAVPGHPRRPGILTTLAAALMARHEAADDSGHGAPQDLVEAASHTEEALNLCDHDHPDSLRALRTRAHVGCLLHDHTGNAEWAGMCIESVDTLLRLPNVPAWMRTSAARDGLTCALASDDARSAVRYVESILSLLPDLLPRFLTRADRTHGLNLIGGIPSRAAASAMATGQPRLAVELSEQARGLLLAEAGFSRLAMDLLRARDHALWAGFVQLLQVARDVDLASGHMARLTVKLTDPDTGQELATTSRDLPGAALSRPQNESARARLERDWRKTADRVSATLGVDSPMTRPALERLTEQARQGPIVIPYTDLRRSDALILTGDPADPVVPIRLPDLHEAEVDARARLLNTALRDIQHEPDFDRQEQAQGEILDTLAWLWDTVTGPVIQQLGDTGAPRLWWSPLGRLASLPLHAAGHHAEATAGLGGPPRTVLDRTISSYAPTIRALESARSPRPARGHAVGTALTVAVPQTEGAEELPHAQRETEQVGKLIAGVTSLTGPQATREAVRKQLADYRIVHFSCHAEGAETPSGGRILLHGADGYNALRAIDLQTMDLPHAELAFLSACSTASGYAKLLDDPVHVAAAFHIAGFRQVIATQWMVSDHMAERVAAGFYDRLTNGGTVTPDTGRSAIALTEIIREIRTAFPLSPSLWAAYLHVGI